MSVNIYQNGALHSVSGGEGHSITALKEASPALSAHSIGSYLSYNDNVYRVKAAINIGDPLVVDTNIEIADLPNDTVVYWEDNTSEAGTSKHTIVNSSDTDMAMRERLQFGDGLITTDDSANGKTVVTANIEDSLTSTSTSKSLSANQGKVLGDEVDAIVNVYGSKNLIKPTASTTTLNGVTFTVNEDGSITADGTSGTGGCDFFYIPHQIFNESYTLTLSGCVMEGTTRKWALSVFDRTDNQWASFTTWNNSSSSEKTSIVTKGHDYYFCLHIEANTEVSNKTFYPMVRDARIKDNTFVSYARNNRELTESIEAIVNLYGSKNLFRYPYFNTSKVDNGITWVDNGDGTCSASGTCSNDGASIFRCQDETDLSKGMYLKNGTYILSGCPAGGATSTRYCLNLFYRDQNNVAVNVNDVGTPITFTINGSYGDPDGALVACRLIVYRNYAISGTLLFKPMIRDARIKDPTFELYAKTNQELTEDCRSIEAIVNVYGSKNLNNYPYYETTKVINGITFTDNGDGSLNINGTGTGSGEYISFNFHSRVYEKNKCILKNGEYIISGCPANGATSKYYMYVSIIRNGSEVVLGIDVGNGRKITINEEAGYAQISLAFVVRSGVTMNNVTIYPMIRDACISDSTWVPYAKTNYELTQDVEGLNNKITKMPAATYTLFGICGPCYLGRMYVNFALPYASYNQNRITISSLEAWNGTGTATDYKNSFNASYNYYGICFNTTDTSLSFLAGQMFRLIITVSN